MKDAPSCALTALEAAGSSSRCCETGMWRDDMHLAAQCPQNTTCDSFHSEACLVPDQIRDPDSALRIHRQAVRHHQQSLSPRLRASTCRCQSRAGMVSSREYTKVSWIVKGVTTIVPFADHQVEQRKWLVKDATSSMHGQSVAGSSCGALPVALLRCRHRCAAAPAPAPAPTPATARPPWAG